MTTLMILSILSTMAVSRGAKAHKAVVPLDTSAWIGDLETSDIWSYKFGSRPDTTVRKKVSIHLAGTCRVVRKSRQGFPTDAELRVDSISTMESGRFGGSVLRPGVLKLSRAKDGRLLSSQGDLSENPDLALLVDALCETHLPTEAKEPETSRPPVGARDSTRWSIDQKRFEKNLGEMHPVVKPGTYKGDVVVDSIASFGGVPCKFVHETYSARMQSVRLPALQAIKQKETVLNMNILSVVPVGRPDTDLYRAFGTGFGMDGTFDTELDGVLMSNSVRLVRQQSLRLRRR